MAGNRLGIPSAFEPGFHEQNDEQICILLALTTSLFTFEEEPDVDFSSWFLLISELEYTDI